MLGAVFVAWWFVFRPTRMRAVAGVVLEAAGAQVPAVDPPQDLRPNVLPAPGRSAQAMAAADLSGGSIGVEAAPLEGELEVSVWDLVDRLTTLAEEPWVFHARALPVIDQLTAACRSELAHTPDLLDELMARVVHDALRVDLVRGAALLAVSPLLEQAPFDAFFRDSFLSPETPQEVLRSACVAASLRGEQPYCESTIDLAVLARLSADVGVELPGIYPVELPRLVHPHEASILAEWLGRDDPHKDLYRASLRPPGPDVDLVAAADFFVTSELLYVAWGQRAQLDDDILAAVVLEASTTFEQGKQRSMVHFRAAQFLVHSLALCNQEFFAAAARSGTSDDLLQSAMADQLRGLLGGGIGIALVARIEELRYSVDPANRGELTRIMMELGKDLALDGGLAARATAEDVDGTCQYLDDLIEDPMLTEEVRTFALKAVAATGSWKGIAQSVAGVIGSNDPDLMQAVAINSLRAAVARDPDRTQEALAMLRQANTAPGNDWRRSLIDGLIAELSGD